MTSDYGKETAELAKYSKGRSEVLRHSGGAILSFLERRLTESRVWGGILLMVLLLALLAQIHAAWSKPFGLTNSSLPTSHHLFYKKSIIL
jgi:hypothetical protein